MNRPLPSETIIETPALLQAMLTHGADVHSHTAEHLTPLHVAVGNMQLHTAEWLLARGADINARDDSGQTPLFVAVQNDDSSTMRLLLSQGANPNVLDVDGNTTLHYALLSMHAKSLLSELMAHGADPNLHAKDCESPLQKAQKTGNREIVRLLKRGGK